MLTLFLSLQPEQCRSCLIFPCSAWSEVSTGVKGKKKTRPSLQCEIPGGRRQLLYNAVRNVQDRTEIPMSTAAMKFSWQSPVWSEGLYAPAMGTCSGCNALFKNTHSIQASGDTFCYSVRSSKCNSAEEETFFLQADGAEPEEGQVDKGDVGVGGCALQESCVRGKLKVRASPFPSVDSANLNSFPREPRTPLHMSLRNKRWDAYKTTHNHAGASTSRVSPAALFTLSSLGRRRPDWKMKFNNRGCWCEWRDEKQQISLSGRRNIRPLLWLLTGNQALWYKAGVCPFLTLFKQQDHLQQFFSTWSNKLKSTPPLLSLTSRCLTSTLLHVHTSRRSLPLPRPQETHLTFSPGLPHAAFPFPSLASRDKGISAEFSQLKHRQLAN